MSQREEVLVHLNDLIRQADAQAAQGREVEVIVAVVNEQDVRPADEEAGTPSEFVTPEKIIPDRRQWCSGWLIMSAVLLLLAGAGFEAYPLLLPTVTITIVPRSLQQETTAEVQFTDVAARHLPEMTLAQETTVKTTGVQHQDATQASGYITFYNSALFVQIIPTGEVLQAGGVEIVTDQGVTLPAGNGDTNGKVTVPAHATLYGPVGNIGAYSINGSCCRPNVLARNLSAFTGGRAARDYQVMQQGDIDRATTTLKASLYQIIGLAIQVQIKPGESIVTPLPCTFTPSSDHRPREEAKVVKVTLSTTCTALAYNQQQMTSLATGQLAAKVGKRYTLAGDVEVMVKTVKTASLTVSLSGSLVYQFEQAEVTQMKHLVAGRSA